MYAPTVAIDPRVDIGHVHLKVADLERALGFWRDVLGFEEQARMGDQAAFISAGGYHHHIGLNTWESEGAAGTTGLYHVAVRFRTASPSRKRCTGCFGPGSSSKAPPITVRARRSTFVTRMVKSRR
ncbi:hypothetical protein BH20ACT13_BH20ACT13_15740 [soil metagenome]